MSPNFLKWCSNALKIANFVSYSAHIYSPGQKEGSYGKVKTLGLYIMYHVFLFYEGFKAAASCMSTACMMLYFVSNFCEIKNYTKLSKNITCPGGQNIRNFSSCGGEDVPHLQTNCEQQAERRDGSDFISSHFWWWRA